MRMAINMRGSGVKTVWGLVLALVMVASVHACSCGKNEEEAAVPVPNKYGFIDEGLSVRTDTVRSGAAFGKMLMDYGMSGADAANLISASREVFDARKFRSGSVLDAYFSCDSVGREKLEYLVYTASRLGSTVFRCADSLYAWNYVKPITHQRRIAHVKIKSSLWNDLIAAGASPELTTNLVDIFQWSINFFGIQEGEQFQIIYTQSVCEDEVVAIDTVHFCLYTPNEGKQVGAMYYDIGSSYGKYWGKNGEGMKKMFLKAPLRYNRISSRFTYRRKHPVTGKIRPHTAVDYAAPKGTPVYALGNGRVTLCGWDNSGGGNRIKIKHAQGYETCYMHLWKFAPGIRSGSVVSQGQLIGYVGSTGRSTGPHLDFRIWQNGKPLDPLKISSPNTDPLPRKYLEDYNAKYDAYLKELEEAELQ